MTRYAITAGVMVTPLVISAPAAYADATGTGSAYALAATGPVPIAPVSVVATTSAQQPTHKTLSELPPNTVADASVLNAVAWAGNGQASVTELKLYKAGLEAD